jgi:hypothetical protein
MVKGLIGLRRTTRTQLLAPLLTILCLGFGCDQSDEPEASPENSTPVTTTEDSRSDPKRSTFAGDWWVICAELPHQAFKLSLLAPDERVDFWEGSWIMFDWRGTSQAGALARASAAVAVNAHRGANGMIIITGPVPQIDAQGLPTGETGAWELAVQLISLTGQRLRYSGSMRHSSDPPGSRALDVELETTFRLWAR